jgi:hypothetical protein
MFTIKAMCSLSANMAKKAINHFQQGAPGGVAHL